MSGQKYDTDNLNATVNSDAKLLKKQKRKLEKAEALNVSDNLSPSKKTTFLDDGSAQISKKKKKKDKGVEKDNLLVNGSVEESTKNKKSDDKSVDGVRESSGVVVSGKDINGSKYKALDSFEESGLSSVVLECCKSFDKPSPIQSNSWPFLLEGRDLIGIAQTGSGKTLAFGIPAINHVLNKKKTSSSKKAIPRCLVLSPTHELAQQISDVLSDSGKPSGLRSVCIYGGNSKGPQISA